MRVREVTVDDGWVLPAEVADVALPNRPQAPEPSSPAPEPTPALVAYDDIDDGWALPAELESSVDIPEPESDKLDIARATRDELLALPGIGPRLADRILDYRGRAPLRCAEDLLRVQGIGPKLLAKLSEHIA